jgi:hypothetical protein
MKIIIYNVFCRKSKIMQNSTLYHLILETHILRQTIQVLTRITFFLIPPGIFLIMASKTTIAKPHQSRLKNRRPISALASPGKACFMCANFVEIVIFT